MSRPEAVNTNLALAAALMLLVYFLFTGMDTTAKFLAMAGIAPMQVVFMRYFWHFIGAIVVSGPREGQSLFRSNAPGLQIARGLSVLVSSILNFTAVFYLPLPVTISMFMASPLLVCLLSVPMLGEKLGPRRLTAIAIGFVGVLVITEPWRADLHWAIFLSFGALVASALYSVLTRRVAHLDSNGTSQVFISAIPALVIAPFGLWLWVWPANWLEWALLVAMGLVGVLGHSLMNHAHRLAQVSALAPLVYVQMIYATVLSWAIFAQMPSTNTVIGTAIIVASGFYIWWREGQLARMRRSA